MKRLLFFFTCIFSVLIISCNDSQEETGGNTAVGDEKALRDLIRQYPDSFLLKENLIQYFRDNGDYQQALEESAHILQYDSLNARVLNIRATLYFENGDTAAAIRDFEKAVAADPQLPYIFALGSLYAQTNNSMALEIADSLLTLPGANAENQAFFIKGLYFSYSGEKIKALAFFNTCLKADYRFVLAYREKAICLYDLKKYATAIDVLKQAVAVQNGFDEAYYWMGRCYEKLDKKKEATDNYKAALQIDPDYVEAQAALANLDVQY